VTRTNAATQRWTLAELATIVEGGIKGNRNTTICRIAELASATPDSIAHCSSPAQVQFLKITQAGIVIRCDSFNYDGDSIITETPRIAFSKVVDLLYPPVHSPPGVHPSAIIGLHSSIANSSSIGPHVVIGDHVTIGNNTTINAGSIIENEVSIDAGTRIGPNSTLYRGTKIGKNCRFSASVVIGAPGFSFEWNGNSWISVRNIGSVKIGNNVDIGACTSIDRGSVNDTHIMDGVRIDNNCHIGHNVQIGSHTLIVANVGIGGSVTIGNRCVIGGQTAIKDNVAIADDVTILATSLVTKSIKSAGTYSSAVPAREAKRWNRTLVRLSSLHS